MKNVFFSSIYVTALSLALFASSANAVSVGYHWASDDAQTGIAKGFIHIEVTTGDILNFTNQAITDLDFIFADVPVTINTAVFFSDIASGDGFPTASAVNGRITLLQRNATSPDFEAFQAFTTCTGGDCESRFGATEVSNNLLESDLSRAYITGKWETAEDNLPQVPVPAAVWLFGSGLIGLVGMARRKKV